MILSEQLQRDIRDMSPNDACDLALRILADALMRRVQGHARDNDSKDGRKTAHDIEYLADKANIEFEEYLYDLETLEEKFHSYCLEVKLG